MANFGNNPGDTVQNLESPRLSWAVDGTVYTTFLDALQQKFCEKLLRL